jgi:uncharacterized protein (UPF0264 family)
LQHRPVSPPQLLVSVRNVAEAESALAAGCDILDLKEPAHGSLGMPDTATIAAVVALAENSDVRVPISVALGEASEWSAARSVPSLSMRIDYLKLGTAGLGNQAGWTGRLNEIRQRFEAAGCTTTDGRGETASDRRSHFGNWIAVTYADWEQADGPAPEHVIAVASECGSAGVLIDTFCKNNGGLFDCLTVDRLALLAKLARSRQLMLALAGKLKLTDIQRLLMIGPEIVGIRSAACRGGVRTGEIDAKTVRTFRQALQECDSRSRRQDAASTGHSNRPAGPPAVPRDGWCAAARWPIGP